MARLAVGPDGSQAAVAETPAPQRGGRPILAAVSGLALAAAFPSLDLEPLAWIGLVPLFLAIDGVRPRRAFLLGWISGVGFYLATCYWVAYTIASYTAVPLPFAAGIVFLMAALLACYTGGFAAAVRCLEVRRLPALWIAPFVWVALEWMRGWFLIGFPWAALGYSQWRYHDLVQIVEVTGVYGVSAVLVFFNAVVAAVLRARGQRPRRLVPALAVLSVLVVGLPLWGRWRAAELAGRPAVGRLTVGIVQGNVEQDHKWDPAYQDSTLARYVDLTVQAARGGARLVVWPETATPFFFQQPGPRRDAVLRLARDNGIHLLFGSPAVQRGRSGEIEELNRAYLVAPDGREVATYDKMQLVPFGEYVPFERVFFFVNRIVHAVGRIVPGIVPTVFELPQGRFGVLICYEDVFPALTRRFMAGGGDFLVNVTNDAWYGPTSAPHQHLAQATFRAIENRVPLVRAANTGISAIIDLDGRVRWRSGLFETLSHVEEIAWPGVRPVYTRAGDIFAELSWAIAVIALAWSVVRARRR
jgi:apolipoprotein N-acyltransferase